MAALPAELQIEVAAKLDLDTLFNSRHTPHFKPLWDNHKPAIYRALSERYRAEAEVFPFAMLAKPITELDQNFWPLIIIDNPRSHNQRYFMHLNVFSDAADAVVAFLKTELSLSETYAQEIRPVILVLWRLFGMTPAVYWRDMIRPLETAPEFLSYFASLGQPSRRRVMRLIRELSTRYQEVFPFDYRAHGIAEQHQAELEATEAPAIFCDYFMLAYLRYEMCRVYCRLTNGLPANAAEAFNRRIPPWAMPYALRPELGQFEIEAWYETDMWSYRVFFGKYRINFFVPSHDDAYDVYRALRVATGLPGYQVLDWGRFSRHTIPSTVRRVSWQIPRPFVELDEHGAPICPGVEFPF
ncbi:hypothetical protein NpPPO83_00010443 [Neofusicoccum parvum]|uniref:Uncharacterized protein n=1 Tax=Neofusicoccum parvum TaxID=310453 RepID=A0ACB5RV52_9PEZI|nr:hypothetical protein NpPPO83_00010443 [Neofusicoccum parvum]